MEYDQLLKQVGEFGRYQRVVFFIGCILYIGYCFDNMGYVFLSAVPEHWCALPDLDHLNLTEEQTKDLALPYDTTNGELHHSKCVMYNLDYANMTPSDALSVLHGNTSHDVVKCRHGWQYDTRQYQSTITTQWDLVCDRRFLATTTQSVFMAGMMLGSFVSGVISDCIGRWKTITICIVVNIVTSIVTSFSVNVIMYMVLRFVVAFCAISAKTVFFVLAIEIVGPKWRKDVGIIRDFFWVAGYLMLDGIAFALRQWRHLQLALSLFLLSYIVIICITPESPRWLYTKGRREEADAVIAKIAKFNKKEVPTDIDVAIQVSDNRVTMLHIFRYPRLRCHAALVCVCWFICSLVYYGLSLNALDLGYNDYISFALSGAIELPAYLFCYLVLNRIGRKRTLVVTTIIGGVALLSSMAVPGDPKFSWILVALSTVGKFGISAAYSALYVYTAELFPTVVRSSGLGAASTVARVGGIIAPQIGLLNDISKYIPLVLFGSLSLAASAIVWFILPETHGKSLPETLHEGDKLKTLDEPGTPEEMKVMT